MLFCLPYSGAGGSAFRELERALPSAIDVAAVRLPGREQRFAEPPGLDLDDIAAAIAARADRPYAIFGHSLGARLGFEVIRLLRRRGGLLPLRLYVAAARPPDAVNPIASAVELDDTRLVEVLIERIDAPSELRDNPEFRDLMLPLLRSDLGWLHRNAYQPGPPLEVPIVALAGAADSVCGGAEMLGWRTHTSASFALHTVPGGHFFPQTQAGRVAGLLSADLLAGAPR